MGLYELEPAEEKLCRAIAHGDRAELEESDEIRAEIIRHIVLRLPLTKDRRSLKDVLRALFGNSPPERVCPKTSVGISIRSGIIKGRLLLDSSLGEGGGPTCPLVFEKTCFAGGFSGAQGHFSRLSFNGCTFCDAPSEESPGQAAASSEKGPSGAAEAAMREATVDLTGATVDSDLEMDDVRPLPEGEGLLWIHASGARIAGKLYLRRARLRSPPDCRIDGSGPARAALDLSLAEVGGDVWFTGGHSVGRINGRGMRVGGDVWMSGACLANPFDAQRNSLHLQAAHIDGVLMLDGEEQVGEDGQKSVVPFTSHGGINLLALKLGVSFVLQDFDVHSGRDFCLNLSGAQVGNSVQIGRSRLPNEMKRERSQLRGRVVFTRMEAKNAVLIKSVDLGSEPGTPADQSTIDAYPLSANHVGLSDIMPLALEARDDGSDGPARTLSINLRASRIGALEVRASRFTGHFRAPSLHSLGDVSIAAVVADKVDFQNAIIDGSLDLSRLRIEGDKSILSLRDATVARVLRLASRAGRGTPETDTPEVPGATAFRMKGLIDLEGLSCDTLDDGAGALWGSDVKIRMNHFNYRRTTWESDGDSARKSSYLRLLHWLEAAAAERLWPMHWSWFGLTGFLRDSNHFWGPWQIRRNWIYRQFDTAPNLLSPSRHPIHELEYRPQPFEQAIRVARGEGREDVATRFEMLKHRIEWRLFNRRSRWLLAALAITTASIWLITHGGSPIATGLAWFATVIMMAFVSWTSDRVEEAFPKLSDTWRPFIVETHFYLPALILFVGWCSQSFHYFAALFIYLAIRFVSVFAHAVMRLGFGYLRRPVRAITTLVLVFLLGWWGVATATANGMLVVDAAPVAGLVAPEDFGNQAAGNVSLVMGSENVGQERFTRYVSCAPTISAPLYALDVLIPLVDLREESRCEVRDVAEKGKVPPAPETIGTPLNLWNNIPELTVRNNGFWAVMKALYAIAGWFVVSLAILTFAQANRMKGEPTG